MSIDELRDVEEPSSGPPLSTVKPARKDVLRGDDTLVFESCLDSEVESERIQALQVVSLMDGVFFVDNVLSGAECERLRARIDESSFLSFWCAGKEDNAGVRAFRNAQTIELFTASFADKIWSRVRHLLADKLSLEIPDDPAHDEYERELVGRWLPTAMNSDNLLARYPCFGSFAPHTDGRAVVDFNRRSHYSALVFFNTVPREHGAGTRFYDKSAVSQLQQRRVNDTEYWTADESLVTAEVAAVAGRLLVFHQALVHEGIPPVAPFLKYILRSDVIFTRTPTVCDSEQDRLAYRLFREAEDLAEEGQVEAAVPLFKKAFKLSPEMARIMGQA